MKLFTFLGIPFKAKWQVFQICYVSLLLRYQIQKPIPDLVLWIKKRVQNKKEYNTLHYPLIFPTLKFLKGVIIAKKNPCFHEALVVFYFYKRAKKNPILYIGVLNNTKGFQSHAWVVEGDKIVIGNLSGLAKLKVILSIDANFEIHEGASY